MSGSVNKVILIGNLGADPDVRTTPSGQMVATISIAMTPALPMSSDMRLVVEVLTRGDEHTPRLACVYSQSPEPHECYARMHALTALVWAASRGKGWDVRAVHGYDARGRVYAGAELALDRATYQAAREGERVLEAVAAGIA